MFFFIQFGLIAKAYSLEHYKTLGLKENSTFEDVKTAFRKLSIKFHPDKSPESYEKYIDIVNAYEAITRETFNY